MWCWGCFGCFLVVLSRALLSPREGSITGGEGATRARGGRGQSLALAEKMPQLNEGVRLTNYTVFHFYLHYNAMLNISKTTPIVFILSSLSN